MRTKRTKRYIDETAKEHGLRSPQVQEVAESMFRFASQIMSEGNRNIMDFGEVRLMGWGVFKVKPGRLAFFKKLNDAKKQERSGKTSKRRKS